MCMCSTWSHTTFSLVPFRTTLDDSLLFPIVFHQETIHNNAPWGTSNTQTYLIRLEFVFYFYQFSTTPAPPPAPPFMCAASTVISWTGFWARSKGDSAVCWPLDSLPNIRQTKSSRRRGGYSIPVRASIVVLWSWVSIGQAVGRLHQMGIGGQAHFARCGRVWSSAGNAHTRI